MCDHITAEGIHMPILVHTGRGETFLIYKFILQQCPDSKQVNCKDGKQGLISRNTLTEYLAPVIRCFLSNPIYNSPPSFPFHSAFLISAAQCVSTMRHGYFV